MPKNCRAGSYNELSFSFLRIKHIDSQSRWTSFAISPKVSDSFYFSKSSLAFGVIFFFVVHLILTESFVIFEISELL